MTFKMGKHRKGNKAKRDSASMISSTHREKVRQRERQKKSLSEKVRQRQRQRKTN